jgi:type II secretory pathway pseudopilin PulG
MPVMSPQPLAIVLTEEQGFTLVELMVAMVMSIIVAGALMMLLVLSVSQETRIDDRVQADRIGRTAMSAIIDELHSSCTGFGATAIQGPSATPVAPLAQSGATDLWFLSTYGTKTSGNATPASVIEHDLHWTSTGTSNTKQTLGTLTDYAFESAGGSSPNWTFPELATAKATTTRILASNVIPPAFPATSTIFQYYKFSAPATAELELVPTASIAAAAAGGEIAKVTVSFSQAGERGDTRLGRTAPFSDSVVLRFNPAETGAEAVNVPCA